MLPLDAVCVRRLFVFILSTFIKAGGQGNNEGFRIDKATGGRLGGAALALRHVIGKK